MSSNWPKWLAVTQSVLFGSKDLEIRSPLAGEANNLKSQSKQEGMCLEAQVNLYNMWTPIGKSDVKFFFQLISSLFTYWHKCKQRVKIFFSSSSKKNSKNNFWK